MNFQKSRRHFERVFSLDLAVFALKLAPPSLPRTPGASIFESETPVFRDFSRRRAINAPNVRHRKNIVKTNTKRTSELPRVDRKSNKNRSACASVCVWRREQRCERLGHCPGGTASVGVTFPFPLCRVVPTSPTSNKNMHPAPRLGTLEDTPF